MPVLDVCLKEKETSVSNDPEKTLNERAETLITNQSFVNTLTSKFSNYLINNQDFMEEIASKLAVLVLSNDDFKQTIFDSMSIEFKEE